MESKFKIGDCVQLLHGEVLQMTVSQIDFNPLQDVKDIKCQWADCKRRFALTTCADLRRPSFAGLI